MYKQATSERYVKKSATGLLTVPLQQTQLHYASQKSRENSSHW